MPFPGPQLRAATNATPLLRGLAVAAVALALGGAATLAAGGDERPAAVSGDVAAPAAGDVAAPAVRPRVAPLPGDASQGVTDPVEGSAPPRLLIVSHEANASVFEERAEFRGIAAPGSVVSSGSAVAAIGPFGHWAIELTLEPGANLKTFEMLDPHGKRTRESIIVNYHPTPGAAVTSAGTADKGATGAKAESATKPAPADQREGETHTKTQGETTPVHSAKKEPPPSDQKTKAGIKAAEFSAHQKYGFCGEDPPYDVFSGSAAAGALISVTSPYGSATTVADENGRWWVTVYFPTAPVGSAFEVHATDGSNVRTFSFVHKL